MPHRHKSLFSGQAATPVDQASALAPVAAAGHFDELRGLQSPIQSPVQSQTQSQSQGNASSAIAPAWTTFFNFLGAEGFDDLNHRTANLRRQIRDNGVTYNVYADANGPQRPWSLDLFPLIISPGDWAGIERGIKQRTRLLNGIMTDVYGPQNLLKQGLLPAALVQGHPGYLRAMQGVQPAGGMFLHIAAFDMAKGPDGKWWVVSQRTQAPSGLGYLLENRLSISMLFSEAFQGMQVQRLADSYKALVDSMKTLSAVANSRIVLLTPGPYNETYFEHAYLARYLGLTLVEGSDLLVRGERLYLKTLQGLEPVHGLLKRLDDEFLDPLELRADSTLGVPGLLQAIRAGNVQVANAPGSAFLESSAMLGFLPALSRHLLGETLSLPSLSTWWCGEQAVMQDMLPQLKNCVIKPTYPGTGMESVIGHTLSQRGLDEWAGRILRHGEDYTVQAYLPLSQTPTWQGDKIAPRSAMLRVFALPDGQGGWRVLPGGLARLAGKNENIASMQHGGSSADVWALGQSAKADPGMVTPVAKQAEPEGDELAPGIKELQHTRISARKQPVTSRAAENLYWLGRYTERAENSLRLAQLTLQSLAGIDQSSAPLLAWLTSMAVSNALVLPTVPAANQTAQARRVFERSLIAGLSDIQTHASVGYNLRSLKSAASAVRERLSQEQWHVIVQMEQDFFRRCEALSSGSAAHDYSSVEALRILDVTSSFLAAITGAQTDRMMRDDGWRLLSIGRHIERLAMLSGAMASGIDTGAVFDDSGFSAIVAMFDSTITFHAQYQQRRDLDALLDLLVLSQDNPRSLSWVIKSLKSRLLKLPGNEPDDVNSLAASLPAMIDMLMDASQGLQADALMTGFEQCRTSALALSDQVSQRYFSHANSAAASHSLSA
ncbi:MAG: circularly permuted type 2 ATP-grasp protein [Polaromonas sp.]